MAKDLIGYRFSPTGEELINDYLRNKNLGKIWLVKDAINEINICCFDPKSLPQLSKIQSDDLVWYFFSPIVYANSKKTTMKRTTGSGFWKPTGKDRIIKDKSGSKSKIGIKKTLVYHEGKVANGVRTSWVMHEYHITCLPSNQTTYVLCQVKYKGDHGDISFGGNGSVVSQSNTVREINTIPEAQVDQPVNEGMFLEDLETPLNIQEDPIPLDSFDPDTLFNDDLPNLPQQIPYSEDDWTQILRYNRGDFDAVFPDLVTMQEDRNVYMPKKALSRSIVDCRDCEDELSAMSYQGTSSPHDSVGNSNKHFLSYSSSDSCKLRLLQRDKETLMVKIEKKSCFVIKKAMESHCKKPQYIYLRKLITSFNLLVGLIGYIKS